jgi:hypothetical protein
VRREKWLDRGLDGGAREREETSKPKQGSNHESGLDGGARE